MHDDEQMTEDERLEKEAKEVAWASLLLVAAMMTVAFAGLAVILSGAARLIYIMWQ